MPNPQAQRRLVLFAAFVSPLLWLSSAGQEARPGTPTDAPFVLHVSAREVVLDVVARDKHNNPVADLAEGDFQVIEMAKHGDKNPRRIVSFRTIDPHLNASHAGATDSGFRISSGAVCALNATTHYQIAIPAAPEPGFHQILVRTTRPDVALSFRHRYYVGQVSDASQVKDHKGSTEGIALGEAACYHSLTPPTLTITAHPVVVPGEGATRYVVVVRPESLSSIGLDGSSNRVQLDFGMCTFDAAGKIVQYLHSTSDRQLTAAEIERAQTRGVVNVLGIPGAEPPYLARFVVRDRQSGNLGIVDAARPISLTAQADKSKALERPVGSIRSFGAVTPREGTFCGDVYELSSGTSQLPDFWNLDPLGSIYTDTLNVIEQDIVNVEGIPGITRNNTWFGVDYYGEFFITKPGDYAFEIQSDDGSRVEIDNQQLIDLDGIHAALVKKGHIALTSGLHSIHVPYFQGPPTSLALMLRIKPPGASMRPFNLAEFAPPEARP